MKLQLYTFAIAGAICMLQLPTTLAGECTAKQLKDLENGSNATPPTEAEIKKACPSVNATAGLNLSNLSSFDFSGFMASSPCKDESCTKFLKKQLTGLPDCEYMGLSVKALTDAVVQLCVDTASGKVTESDIFGFFANMTDSSESRPADGSSPRPTATSGNEHPSLPDDGSKDLSSDNLGSLADSGSGAFVTDSNSTTTAPAPTKSSAGALTTATTAIAVSAALSGIAL